MKNKIIIILISILLFSCKVQESTTGGHDCSHCQMINKDSIFITGEHIHLLPENLCSYEEDEWFIIEEEIVEINPLKID
jgi:hypothetical protein